MYDPVDERDVFICHASEDAQVAGDLVARLEASGVSCWIAPRDVRPGTTYADSLYHAIERAPVFVVLMSGAANASSHAARELEIADQMQKRVVPVRLEGFEATGAFCYYTRAAHFYRWRENPHEVLSRISEQVEGARAARGTPARQEPDSPRARPETWWRSAVRRPTGRSS